MYQLFQCMMVKLVVNMVYTKVCLSVLDYLTYIHIRVAPSTRHVHSCDWISLPTSVPLLLSKTIVLLMLCTHYRSVL